MEDRPLDHTVLPFTCIVGLMWVSGDRDALELGCDGLRKAELSSVIIIPIHGEILFLHYTACLRVEWSEKFTFDW